MRGLILQHGVLVRKLLSPSRNHDTIAGVSRLIEDFRFELAPDHHNPGSGRYGLCVTFSEDISAVLPYLNTLMERTQYDHANHILVCKGKEQGYAFRPHEIRLAQLPNPSEAALAAEEVVGMVNRVWAERDRIEPSLKKLKKPAVYDIFKLLPRTNCKKCGCATCLAFAADLRSGKAKLEQCAPLGEPDRSQERERVAGLF